MAVVTKKANRQIFGTLLHIKIFVRSQGKVMFDNITLVNDFV